MRSLKTNSLERRSPSGLGTALQEDEGSSSAYSSVWLVYGCSCARAAVAAKATSAHSRRRLGTCILTFLLPRGRPRGAADENRIERASVSPLMTGRAAVLPRAGPAGLTTCRAGL